VELEALPDLGGDGHRDVTNSPHWRFADHSSLISILSTLGRIERAAQDLK
jgi:hypothetical protein